MGKTIRPLIAGNWKMNGVSTDLEEITLLVGHLNSAKAVNAEVLLCLPATLISRAIPHVLGSEVKIGGQDCHSEAQGAFTGDISAAMLLDAGAAYVIVGHSERRQAHFETNQNVREKATSALKNGLVPIICVGETQDERNAGQANQIIAEQVLNSLPDYEAGDDVVVAYEPIWAIGTGKTATTDDILQMHGYIREILMSRLPQNAGNARILYGGSVKAENAKAILALDNVNGALVGGASLKAKDFFSIIEAA